MNEIIDSQISAKENDVTPKDLLIFAKWILCIIAMMFILGCLSELIMPGNKVFEICKISLPSFATLIIGFYFGKN